MDKKIVEKLVDMGLITYMGVDADKFNSVDELIDSGVITATIDRNKLYEIIDGDVFVAPVVETIIEPIIEPKKEEEIIVEPKKEEETIIEPIVEDEVKDVVVDEESIEEEKPKTTKKTNKKAE